MRRKAEVKSAHQSHSASALNLYLSPKQETHQASNHCAELTQHLVNNVRMPNQHTHQDTNSTVTEHTASNLYTLPYRRNQLKYMHQIFFSASIKMIIDAVHNNQLKGTPFLNNPILKCKYLPPSLATSKGQMKGPHTGIRITRPKPKKWNARH